jgi:putative aldouronate transport system substrate-binding protein
MRKRLMSLISIGISLSIGTAILTACGKKTESTAKNTDTKKEVVKPDKITFMADTILTQENGLDKFCEEYKKLTGIELEVIKPVHNQYYEKVDLAIASGDVPDVIGINDGQLPKYVASGALYDVTDLYNKSDTLKKINSSIIEAIKMNDKLYGVPYEDGNGTLTAVRKDWLDKLNLKAPTNYDEFYNMLKQFKTIGDDVIPLTAAGLDTPTYLVEFYQQARPNFALKNGKWVDGMVEPEMKAALERLRKAYSEGLIDKEILTNKTNTSKEKWGAGRVGVFNYWAGKNAGQVYNEVKQGPAGKDAEALFIPPIKETKYINRVAGINGITKTCKNPEGVFKYLLEYMNDGGEGSDLFIYGVQGVHYEVKDNTITALPAIGNPKTMFYNALAKPELALVQPTKYKYNMEKAVEDSRKIFEQNMVVDPQVPSSKTLNKINADLLALRQKTLAEIVLGSKTFDESMATYTKETENLNIQQVLSELNTK